MIGRSGCGFAVLAACAVAATPARAELVYELSPSAGAGASDNVSATGVHSGDEFTLLGAVLRLRYSGALATHVFGYSIGYSKYLQKTYPDTLAHTVNWLSTVNPSARWTLRFGANGTVGRSSGLDAANPITVMPGSTVAGSSLYLTTTALQGIDYSPTPRWTYNESLIVGYFRYLDAMETGLGTALPRTLYATLALRLERMVGREAFTGEVDVTDTSTSYPGGAAPGSESGQWLFGRALAGWRHELSPNWSSDLQAGPSFIVLPDGSGVAAPAAVAALNYTRVPWLASLIATQTPMPQPYLGAAILADQVLARLMVPLTRNERIIVGGFGGYSYARIANANGNFDRAYDQFLGGLSLVFRFPKMPLAAAASYTVTTQRGGNVPGYAVPDLAYQYAFVTIRGDLAWGAGTPPVFGGAQ